MHPLMVLMLAADWEDEQASAKLQPSWHIAVPADYRGKLIPLQVSLVCTVLHLLGDAHSTGCTVWAVDAHTAAESQG
jgi:hypothetical protein